MPGSTTSEQWRMVRAAWLQAVMQHRCLSEHHAEKLYKTILKPHFIDPDELSFPDFLQTVSRRISEIGLDIRRFVDQFHNVPVIALVNTKGDEIAQVATSYTATELAFIKKLIEVIFTAPDEAYCVGSTVAMRIGSQIQPQMTQRASEALLHNLVKRQWLTDIKGKLALSSRALLELQGYLKNEFPDHLLECHHCKDILTRGQACSNTSCPVRLHLHCAEALGRGGPFECPECQRGWTRPLPVGPESLGSGRKPSAAAPGEEESDADSDDEGSHAPFQQSGHAADESDDELEYI